MTAFAIVIDGEIDIRTVSPTAIGAMVNWLVVTCGAIVQHGVSDNAIRDAFQTVAGNTKKSVECCPVEVRRALQ